MQNYACLLAFLMLFTAGTVAAVDISSCQTLNSAGASYQLTTSVSSASTCFTINAANVTLDCAGFKISGPYQAMTNGIYSNAFNSTVKNCVIEKFQYGIFIENAGNATLFNNTIFNSTYHGIQLGSSSYNNISNNTMSTQTYDGIDMYGSSQYNTVISNKFNQSGRAGIYFRDSSTYNLVYLNNFTGNVGRWIRSDATTNYYNTTISGKGVGNIYYAYNGSGAWTFGNGLTWTDNDLNNFADAGTLPVNSTSHSSYWERNGADYYPFRPASCLNLSAPNTDNSLPSDITVNGSTCFNITAANVTLDCAGHSITGNNSTGTYGVYSTAFNTTVMNCNISNFYHALYFEGASSSSITNVTASSTSTGGMGIFLNASHNSTIRNSNATSSASHGIGVLDSNNTLINNSTGQSLTSGSGIYLQNSHSSNLTNDVVYTSSGAGALRLSTCNYNTISNLSASTSSSPSIYLQVASYNNITNSTSTTTSGWGILIFSSSNYNYVNNCTAASQSDNGVSLQSSSMYNTIANSTISSVTDNALYISSSSNNTYLNNSITSNATVAYFKNSSNGTIISNRIVSGSPASIALLFDANSANNLAYYNNVSGSGPWISNSNSANQFNTTIAGKGVGNIYYLSNGTPSWEVYEALDANKNSYADIGNAIPFGQQTLGASIWSGSGGDSNPFTTKIQKINITNLTAQVVLSSKDASYVIPSNATFSQSKTNLVISADGVALEGSGSIMNITLTVTGANNVQVSNLNLDPEYGLIVTSASNGVYENLSFTNITNKGIWVTNSSSNNTFRNISITTSQSGRAFYIDSGANNIFDCQGGTIRGVSTSGIYALYSNQAGTEMSNCRFFDFYGALELGSSSSSNLFHHNQFTKSLQFWANDSGSGNQLYKSIGGVNQGNSYHNTSLYSLTDSNLDGYADSGSSYPLSSLNAPGPIIGAIADYGPIMVLPSQFAAQVSASSPLTLTNSLPAGTAGAWGGNVSLVNLTINSSTLHWQGFYGTVEGSIALGAGKNVLKTWSLSSISGQVYASSSPTIDFSSLANTPVTLAQMDAAYAFLMGKTDAANRTGTDYSNRQLSISSSIVPANSRPAIFTRDAAGASTWETVVLSQDASDSNSYVYAAILEQNKKAFTNETANFQMMVPVNNLGNTNAVTYYFYGEVQ